jgi:hypothetical protein
LYSGVPVMLRANGKTLQELITPGLDPGVFFAATKGMPWSSHGMGEFPGEIAARISLGLKRKAVLCCPLSFFLGAFG